MTRVNPCLLGIKKSLVLVGIATLVTACSFSNSEKINKGNTAITDHNDLPTSELKVTSVVDGLDSPWAFTWLPNGDVLITEKFGNLRVAKKGNDGNYTLSDDSISGVPEVYSEGHGGLLDVTVHPDFAKNRFIYLSYSVGDEEQNKLQVAKAKLNGNNLEEMKTVFEVSDTKSGTQHYGSKFLWLEDGTLLISVGDGGNPPVEFEGKLIREQAQKLDSHFGTIIRINDDGSIPDDNPFINVEGALSEIWSYGHRNVQGISMDPKSQQVFASEHGSRGGDEVNQVNPGDNYGWPLTTYSVEYDFSGTPISFNQSLPSLEEPIAVWTPSIAPSDIVYYSGEQYENWQGDIFLAAMLLRSRDSLLAYPFSPAGAIIKIDLDENNVPVSQQLFSLGDIRVRGLEQGPDGFLYALTNPTSLPSETGDKTSQILRLE